MWKENGGEPSVPENFLYKALSSSVGVGGWGKILLAFLKASSADDCVFYGEPVYELQIPSYPHQTWEARFGGGKYFLGHVASQ